MASVHAKLQEFLELRKALATVYVDSTRLLEEALPMPKKVAAATFGPATVELMKDVKEMALDGDMPLLVKLSHRTVWRNSCGSTQSGDEMDLNKEMDNNPEPQAGCPSPPSRRHLL
eukprot:2911874-Amphidinium_carterae.1